MGAIFKRDFTSYFNSAIGYITMAVFFFFSGLYFYTTCLYTKTSDMYYVFQSMFLVIMFVIPLFTMKLFSEERKQKTDQALLTSPISNVCNMLIDICCFWDNSCFYSNTFGRSYIRKYPRASPSRKLTHINRYICFISYRKSGCCGTCYLCD